MRRGFKSAAERRAAEARASLGLSPIVPLCPWNYAEFLSVMVLGADELDLEPHHAKQLLEKDVESWSGMTLDEDGIRLVVLNSSQGKARQSSTLMHELAHILLEHVPSAVTVSDSGLVLLSDYSDEQEEEADWLMGALLLPEAALLHHRGAGRSLTEIAEIFRVSSDLCNWRSRMTGVEKRMSFRQRR